MNRLSVGDRIVYDDSDCTIEAIGAGHVLIRADTRELYSLTPTAVHAAHRAETLTPVSPQAAAALSPVLDGLAPATVADAHERLGHVHEVLTGYRSGTPDDDPSEPRPGYDPALVPNLGDRQRTKAEELGCSERTVRNWCQRYREFGVAGLVDQRRTGLVNLRSYADPNVVEGIEYLIAHGISTSTGKRGRFVRRLRQYVKEKHNLGPDDLPSDKTLLRLVDAMAAGSYLFGKATTRRSRAMLRPKVFQGFSATRAGEVVLIDGNRFDVLAWDPETDTAIAVECLMAMDSYSRVILAGRFVPVSADRVDACMLLADILNPLETRDHWADSVRFSALQVPFERLVDIDERLAHAAARPVMRPETLLVDNAKIFISHDFRRACEQLGISIGYARARQGTDKAQIERAFGTLGSEFLQHCAGFKGNTTVNRGEHVERGALFTIAELEDLFSEWVVVAHNRRISRGLSLSWAPDVTLSPIEMYHESIARCGYLPLVENKNLFFDLLPTVWVTIEPGYVDIRGLSYSGPAVVGRDHEPSPYSAQKCKWPAKYDPRDRLYAYIQDRDGAWCPLRWIHAREGTEPFTDRTADFARRTLAQSSARRATQAEVADELIRLQGFVDIPPAEAAKLRRRRSRDVERARHAHNDRANAGIDPLESVAAEEPSPDEEFDPATLPRVSLLEDLLP